MTTCKLFLGIHPVLAFGLIALTSILPGPRGFVYAVEKRCDLLSQIFPLASNGPQFSARDFESFKSSASEFFLTQKEYSVWASETANSLAHEFKGPHPARSVLDSLAQKRNLLTKLKDPKNEMGFGVLRSAEDQWWRNQLYSSEKKLSDSSRRILAEIEESIAMNPATEKPVIHYNKSWEPNFYTALNSDKIEGSRLLYMEYKTSEMGRPKSKIKMTKSYSALTPKFNKSQLILSDVLERVELVRKGSTSLSEKNEHFLRAVYGFFNASPYRNSNEDIGRIFFTGLFESSYHIKLDFLDEGIESSAKVMWESQFLSRYKPKLEAILQARVQPHPN